MSVQQNTEVWLRGPLPHIPDLLQPVAHALLQAREEIYQYVQEFPEQLLWERPAQVAAVGFHLQHITGVLDRLFTYARNEALNQNQLAFLAQEGKPTNHSEVNVPGLVQNLDRQIDLALLQLQHTNPALLTEYRAVGRAKLPSTLLGLYVHAAEHTQRHVGQILVTIKIVKAWHHAGFKLS